MLCGLRVFSRSALYKKVCLSIFYTKRMIKSSELLKNEKKDGKKMAQDRLERLENGKNGIKLCMLHKKHRKIS